MSEADAVHGFPTPVGPPTFLNRFVKTKLRLMLSGAQTSNTRVIESSLPLD